MNIDLTSIPFPDVIETLEYEQILADHIAYFKQVWAAVRLGNPAMPDYDVEMLETDPVKIVLEASAYREMLLRARVNDAARALMLASSSRADLDQFAADFDMERLVVGRDADDQPIYESDDDFRKRRQLAPGGYAAAGPEEAYRYFALSADGRIKQVEAVKGENNRCDIVLLGRDGNGSVGADVVTKVHDALSARTRRPLTDNVYVRSAAIVEQSIRIRVSVQTGPDPATMINRARDSVQAYAAKRASIGSVLRLDGIIGAAHANNSLESVEVVEPAGDLDPGKFGAVYVPQVIVERA